MYPVTGLDGAPQFVLCLKRDDFSSLPLSRAHSDWLSHLKMTREQQVGGASPLAARALCPGGILRGRKLTNRSQGGRAKTCGSSNGPFWL